MDIKFTGSIDGVFEGTWNDFSFDGTRDIKLVTGSDYVKQKVIKALITPIGSDYYFPGYGTELPNVIHGDINDPIIKNKLTETILGVITYLETQETSTDPSERIASVDDIQFTTVQEQNAVYITVQLTLQNDEALNVIISG